MTPLRAARLKPGDILDGVELIVFDKDGTLIEFHLMWGGWLEELARRLEREAGLALRDGLYPLLGVDQGSGMVLAHGLTLLLEERVFLSGDRAVVFE